MSLQGTYTHSKTPEDIVNSAAPATPRGMDHAFGVDPPTFSLDPLQDDGAMQRCARHKKWTTHSALTPRIRVRPSHNAPPVTYT